MNIIEMDGSDWMRDLPIDIRANRPLCQLVIPGTHDSFTYHLNKNLPVGPDTDKGARRLGNVFPCVKSIIYNWSKCQNMDVEEQLNRGVRYLDIRLGILPQKYCKESLLEGEENLDKFRFIHALYGDSIKTPFEKLRNFLDGHPSEVVILDIQHTYSFSQEDHEFLALKILKYFGPKLCPKTEAMHNLTLDYMKHKGYQIIVIYPKMSKSPIPGNQFLWPRESCRSPWANTTKLSILEPFLKNGLEHRDNKNAFFVSQVILTPTTNTVVSHLSSSLERSLAKTCDKFAFEWISNHPSNLNIVIVDFVEKDNIIKAIIQNNK